VPAARLTRKRIIVLTILAVLLPTAFLGYLSVKLQRDMFEFQNRILDEYALYSVDYAVSAVQDRIRSKERAVHTQFQIAAAAHDFEPGAALRRLQESYPLIEHAFLLREDGTVTFAIGEDDDPDTGAKRQAAVAGQDPLWVESLLHLGRDTAAQILQRVLDRSAYVHLLESPDAHFFRGQEGGAPFHMTAFALPGTGGKARGVAGFFLKLPYVREKFLASQLEESIAAAEGRFSKNFGRYLTFVISDHKNELVYVHKRPGTKGAFEDWEMLAEAELWDVLPGWKVRLAYANPKGPTYRRDIYLSNTLLLLLMAAIAMAGVLFSLRFSLQQMELSNVKSHFVSNITHELKTPLAAIRLYTETLQHGRVKDAEQEHKFLGIIAKESVRLTHLINNILDFSRIEMDRKRYTFEPTAVGDVVKDVLESYSYQLNDKGFTVRTEFDGELPRVRADRDALGQAVLNLIDNAMKYSPDHKEIDVAVRRDGAGVAIAVTDQGIGIPASELKKVFDAFYRVEKGLEHDVKGSGLGLAVVKHVVESHGGRVDVQSRRGAGSTFTIRLPVMEA
jgi:signal transduction histidine kinase